MPHAGTMPRSFEKGGPPAHSNGCFPDPLARGRIQAGISAPPPVGHLIMHASAPRRAVTLIELMVVIAIVAVLMTLLFPAVTGAIESSRKLACATKTTKLALAMSSYDSRQGFFPGIRNNLAIKSPGGSGLRLTSNKGSDLAPGHFPMPNSTTNWFVMLLPHLERTDTFDAVVNGLLWVGNTNMGTPSNHRNLTRTLTECPSRGDFYTLAYSYQNMHYKANATSPSSNRNDGVLGDNSNKIFVSLADVVAGDGVSTTLLIAEGRRDSWYPKTWSDPGNFPKIAGLTSYGTFVGIGGHNNNPPNHVHPDPGGGMLFGFPPSTPSLNATTRIINVTNGPSYYPTSAEGSFGNQASSVHSGGANVAFVDGSCRFLQDTLQPHVYGHLLTHRSLWNGSSYSTNSATANAFLQCLPATKPYTVKPGDY